MKLKAITNINIETLKSVIPKNPVPKRRTALWFFLDEQKKRHLEERNDSDGVKINRSKLLDHWKGMKPENKREYFNLAEMDKFRYLKQKALWTAHLCSIMTGPDSDLHLSQDAIDESDLGTDQKLYNMFHNYKNIIEAKSTQSIYKDVLANSSSDSEKSTEMHSKGKTDYLSDVPEPYRFVLTSPRRPPPACVIFYKDNKERITELRKEKYPKDSFFKVASQEWSKLSPEEKDVYEERYKNWLKEYLIEMEKFRISQNNTEGSCFDEASKEKKALTRSLRMTLRNFSAVPRNVRNAFNFYVIHNRNLPIEDLSKAWRELPEEEKVMYKRMSDDDKTRYREEKELYEMVSKELEKPRRKKRPT